MSAPSLKFVHSFVIESWPEEMPTSKELAVEYDVGREQ